MRFGMLSKVSTKSISSQIFLCEIRSPSNLELVDKCHYSPVLIPAINISYNGALERP